MSFETASSGSASGSWQPEGERPICLRCEVPIYEDEGVWRREATGSPVCWRNPANDGHEPRPTPVPAQPDTADEALARVIHVGYWGPSAEGDVTPSRGSFAAAVAVLAAGYVSPATLAQREAAAGAEALREAADEWPGWWKFTRWLRDRATTLARQEPTSAEGAGS